MDRRLLRLAGWALAAALGVAGVARPFGEPPTGSWFRAAWALWAVVGTGGLLAAAPGTPLSLPRATALGLLAISATVVARSGAPGGWTPLPVAVVASTVFELGAAPADQRRQVVAGGVVLAAVAAWVALRNGDWSAVRPTLFALVLPGGVLFGLPLYGLAAASRPPRDT